MAAQALSIPAKIRHLGKCIDPTDLRIGDVVLSSPIAPGFFGWRVAQAIRYSQEDLAEDHAIWTHVGLYLGNFRVLEAVPWRGVCVHALWDRMTTHQLRFLRPGSLSADQHLTYLAESAGRLGERYGYRRALELLWARVFGSRQSVADRSAGPICSSVIADAYLIAAGVPAVPLTGKPARPGELSMSRVLTEVAVTWKSLA